MVKKIIGFRQLSLHDLRWGGGGTLTSDNLQS